MAFEDVPTIDISPYLNGGGGEAERDAVAKQVDDACMEIGFFAITGHGVPKARIEALRQDAVDFFAQPADVKAEVERPESRISRGWYGVGDRSLAYSIGQETPPDMQESFAIGPIDAPDDGYHSGGRAGAFFAPNMWPSSMPSVRTEMTRYFAEMETLSHAVMQIFARALGMSDDFFDDKIDKHTSSLRLIRYPGQAADAAPGQRRAGEHTDYGTLTILHGDNLPGGLQVKLRHGDWVDVTRPEGGFICNIGDAMMRWTNDRWVSNLHRVGVPAPGTAAPDRISIVFFHNPNYDARMRCITAGKEAQKYPDCDFDDYYLEKLMKGSYGAAQPIVMPER